MLIWNISNHEHMCECVRRVIWCFSCSCEWKIFLPRTKIVRLIAYEYNFCLVALWTSKTPDQTIYAFKSLQSLQSLQGCKFFSWIWYRSTYSRFDTISITFCKSNFTHLFLYILIEKSYKPTNIHVGIENHVWMHFQWRNCRLGSKYQVTVWHD